MTLRAGTQYIGVVDQHNRHPGVYSMTGFTQTSGWHMRGRLADKLATVMAVSTGSCSLSMIHGGYGCPRQGIVARFTLIGNGHMKSGFSARSYIVMTAYARGIDLVMIKRR